MKNELICYIDPQFNGALTLKDLLSTVGTISFDLHLYSEENGIIFNLSYLDFKFELKIENSSICFTRNNSELSIGLSDIQIDKVYRYYFIWNYDSLTLSYFPRDENQNEDSLVSKSIKTSFMLPPIELIREAKKIDLLPVNSYNSMEEFRNKVYSIFLSIGDKINDSIAFDSFWNIEYKGQRIEKRLPKREVEVQPFIHAMIADSCMMASIEIVPEYVTSAGNADFAFIGNVNSLGQILLIVEVKNAHSQNLEHGLVRQLPAYMEAKNTYLGAYIVLDYRGLHFGQPKTEDENDLEIDLNIAHQNSPNPFLNDVRVFLLKLGKSKSASIK